MRIDFEALRRAGHDLTHVSGPVAGVSWYWCENCGAIMSVLQSELAIFLSPPPHRSTEKLCAGYKHPKQRSLRELLAEQRDAAWTRFEDGNDHE